MAAAAPAAGRGRAGPEPLTAAGARRQRARWAEPRPAPLGSRPPGAAPALGEPSRRDGPRLPAAISALPPDRVPPAGGGASVPWQPLGSFVRGSGTG